jgi:hypothetical protein
MGEGWRDYFPVDSLAGLGGIAALASEALERLGEEPLHPARPDRPPVVRLLCLPTWSPACSVRAEVYGVWWRLFGRELEGKAGFELGELTRRDERLVTEADAERVTKLWTYLRFWSIPRSGGEEVLDGTTYVLEAAERGRYRVIYRDDPEWGDTFVEFSDLLVHLAGLAPR